MLSVNYKKKLKCEDLQQIKTIKSILKSKTITKITILN